MPVKGREGLVEINSKKLPGKLAAGGTADVEARRRTTSWRSRCRSRSTAPPGVRELLDAVAKSRVPCMSIMNMPPLPYLARIPGVDAAKCARRLHRSDGVGRASTRSS